MEILGDSDSSEEEVLIIKEIKVCFPKEVDVVIANRNVVDRIDEGGLEPFENNVPFVPEETEINVVEPESVVLEEALNVLDGILVD